MLLDTNILIDLLRGYRPALESFGKILHRYKISTITKFELIVGATDKIVMKKILKNLELTKIQYIPITADICEISENLLVSFYLSHGLSIEDSFIAATSLVYDEELVTRNIKHFNFIPNLKLIIPY